MRVLLRWMLSSLLVLAVSCGGGGGSSGGGGAPPVAEATPAPGTYYVGGSDGVFNLIEDNTSSLVLELTSASPDLDPGNFLVGLDDEGFIREVLTQEQPDPRDPNWIIADTSSATIPDAFTEFDLDLDIDTARPATPGAVAGCLPNSFCISITSPRVIYDDGTIRATITSASISVSTHYWGKIRLGQQLFDINYRTIAEGSATVRFELIGANGSFNREVLVPGTSFRIPIQIGWVPLTLRVALNAGFTLSYNIDSTVDVTVDFQRGTVGSLHYDPVTGWDAQSTDLSEGVSPPLIDYVGEVDVVADLYLRPELTLSIFNVVGIGASVEPYLQVEVDAAMTPCGESWGKFYSGGIRADITAFANYWIGSADLVYPIGDWTLLAGEEQSRILSGTLVGGNPGDPVVLSGDTMATAYADVNGLYCFIGLPRGSYCVTPPTICSPTQMCDSIVDADVPGVDFCCPVGCVPPTITTTNLPAGTVGVPYSACVAVVDGTGPLDFVAGSVLPPGLTLDSSTGCIAGVPTDWGSFNVNLQVCDSCALCPLCDSQVFQILVAL